MADSSAESRSTLDLSGKQLGDYHLLRRLGRGGMADVYLAEQGSLRRQVAFKVLRGDFAHDASYIRRFHNEAQAAAKLVHANIVQIHEVGCIEGVHFIAQEYVPGRNLKQFLKRSGAVTPPLAVNVMRQVAAAMHRAAEQGIIHRDIKPENIMLSSTGEVKVADFGLARKTDGEAVDLTQVGITMGTPLYMSPEQVEGGAVDPRSDIYSFGVTCYHMAAGRPPFDGDSPLAVAVQHLNNEPDRLENLRPDYPENLCRIIHKMLAKQPANRFQRPAELLRELRQVQITGTDEWPEGMEEWSTPELLALADARIEATQRLDAAMKSHQTQGNRLSRAVWGLLALSAVFLGGLAAWIMRPDALLAIPEGTIPAVERKDTAEEQYWHAMMTNSERAWLSVEQHFKPTDSLSELYVRKAWRGLAEFYRDQNRPAEAKALYDKLTELEGEDPYFGAVGLVGNANLLAQQGESSTSRAKLAALVRLWSDLQQLQRDSLFQQLDAGTRTQFQALLASERATEVDGEA